MVVSGLNILIIFCIVLLSKSFVDWINSSKFNRLKDSIYSDLFKKSDFKYSHYSDAFKGIEVKMDWLDKFQLKYIERSNLKDVLPFANVQLLIVLLISIFVGSALIIFPILKSFLTSILFSFIFANIPLILLDLRSKQMSEKSRREIYGYVSSLRAWSHVQANILYIFEKASEDTLGVLSTYTKQMVAQIKSGLSAEMAMEILRMKVNNQYFDTVMLNMTHAFANQGDISSLLAKLESEASKLEKAYNQRKIKTLLDRTLVFGMMVGILIVLLMILAQNETARHLYIEEPSGRIVLTVASLIYTAGVMMLLKITNFEH
ncbi:MAG: type II secretion system F family protein [Clostridia bacterium]|nr:type II secretion system F family protein [Clostridia bacterium]